MRKDRTYYVSNYDNDIHNLMDVEHSRVSETDAYIGKDCGEDGFRVDDEVNVWTIDEILEFFKK